MRKINTKTYQDDDTMIEKGQNGEGDHVDLASSTADRTKSLQRGAKI